MSIRGLKETKSIAIQYTLPQTLYNVLVHVISAVKLLPWIDINKLVIDNPVYNPVYYLPVYYLPRREIIKLVFQCLELFIKKDKVYNKYSLYSNNPVYNKKDNKEYNLLNRSISKDNTTFISVCVVYSIVGEYRNAMQDM